MCSKHLQVNEFYVDLIQVQECFVNYGRICHIPIKKLNLFIVIYKKLSNKDYSIIFIYQGYKYYWK